MRFPETAVALQQLLLCACATAASPAGSQKASSVETLARRNP
ncbi:MAG TPA: hypothetical protein VGK67_33075 [Myxococcales bacterium]|jgi:hypothetical protein